MSVRRPDERTGHARWLAGKECTRCWYARRADTGNRLTKHQWLERKRAEEAAAIAEWEQRAGMPRLDGSEKAVAWGRRTRHAILTGAYNTLVTTGGMGDEQWVTDIEDPVRLIARASWWIDNRDADPDEVAKLVEAARAAVAVARENQFA